MLVVLVYCQVAGRSDAALTTSDLRLLANLAVSVRRLPARGVEMRGVWLKVSVLRTSAVIVV